MKDEEHTVCSQCGRELGVRHTYYEDYGEQRETYSAVNECGGCGELYCDDCYAELKTCEICGKGFCDECFKSAEEVGGGIDIQNSGTNLCYECGVKNEEHRMSQMQ